jgi:DNA polymerase/3'-5' exonuclease PolX
MQHAHALAIANALIERLSPACERLEIAGSVRRGKAEVGDLELVAIPRIRTVSDLFGTPMQQQSLLDTALAGIGIRRLKDGPRYKQIVLAEGIRGHDISALHAQRAAHQGRALVDLFITDRARWGWIFLLRTGPQEFSHWLVKPKRYGGGLPSYLHADEGALWRGNQMIETPEERDALQVLGLPWMEPSERKPIVMQLQVA